MLVSALWPMCGRCSVHYLATFDNIYCTNNVTIKKRKHMIDRGSQLYGYFIYEELCFLLAASNYLAETEL